MPRHHSTQRSHRPRSGQARHHVHGGSTGSDDFGVDILDVEFSTLSPVLDSTAGPKFWKKIIIARPIGTPCSGNAVWAAICRSWIWSPTRFPLSVSGVSVVTNTDEHDTGMDEGHVVAKFTDKTADQDDARHVGENEGGAGDGWVEGGHIPVACK
ncbi:uncharacterized protein BCR38DRAFT_478679 [Pseudomassariella vexata]|uniref:Uncharacterized protein n=1 Tax=Pseudomassariella vexata TaxID=1141098 RepID=A0A1Y2DBV9_9PEZI|nr:uncharacterized protein BCR38DRAFT_478679 [Pseudomassariella vexata]ORY56634.1 hypothetical protein BCR38DRAFT_478679 [Pseudomassariella vexata]